MSVGEEGQGIRWVLLREGCKCTFRFSLVPAGLLVSKMSYLFADLLFLFACAGCLLVFVSSPPGGPKYRGYTGSFPF